MTDASTSYIGKHDLCAERIDFVIHQRLDIAGSLLFLGHRVKLFFCRQAHDLLDCAIQ